MLHIFYGQHNSITFALNFNFAEVSVRHDFFVTYLALIQMAHLAQCTSSFQIQFLSEIREQPRINTHETPENAAHLFSHFGLFR